MTEQTATQYLPRKVTPPGETLVEMLDERGMTQAELATRTGRPLKTINEIIKGKTAITPETALQLERVLGLSADFWSVREQRYQDWKARQQEAVNLLKEVDWLKELPLKDMIRRRWVDGVSDKVGQMLACLRFFAVASVSAWREQCERPLAVYRASAKVEKKIGAMAAWLRKGELDAEALLCRPFDKEGFKRTLEEVRGLTQKGDPAVFVPELVRLCASAGVAVAFVPAPKGCPASGATKWLTSDKALLMLSLRHKTNDHLWFTFFHEAGHLLLHGKKMLFLEGNGLDGEAEKEADKFARDFLIPPGQMPQKPRGAWSEKAVREAAARLGIAPGILVGRLQKEKSLPWTHLNALKVSYTWSEEEDDSSEDSQETANG